MGKQKTFRKDKWCFRRIDGSYGSFMSVRGILIWVWMSLQREESSQVVIPASGQDL